MVESVLGGEVNGMCRISSMAEGRMGRLAKSTRTQAEDAHVRE